MTATGSTRPVRTIEDVVARLEKMEKATPASDGVHWFNRLYLDVTRGVQKFCKSGSLKAPPFLEDLDVYFGSGYFQVVGAADNGAAVPLCWRPLFDARYDGRIAPLQFALAGLNAHINHDLAIGIVSTCTALGVEPRDDSGEHEDYEGVNEVMQACEEESKRWLLTGAVKELDHAVAPVDDTVAVWSIEDARNAAWARAKVLWEIRGQSELTVAYLAALDATVGMEGRALLLPRDAGAEGPLIHVARVTERATRSGISAAARLIGRSPSSGTKQD